MNSVPSTEMALRYRPLLCFRPYTAFMFLLLVVFISSFISLGLVASLMEMDSTMRIDEFEYNYTTFSLNYNESLPSTNVSTNVSDFAVSGNSSSPRKGPTLQDFFQKIRNDTDPINPFHFSYTLNPSSLCSGQDLVVVVYVHTSPDHLERRMTIRETWGNPKNFEKEYMRVVFVVGLPEKNDTQNYLEMESRYYGDILQANFVDSYRNLTYKAMLGLKWTSSYCSHVPFVLKTDDDMFVNVFNLVRHLRSLYAHGINTNMTIMCFLFDYASPVYRNKANKWYVSPREFADTKYPIYCSGTAWIYSMDLVTELFRVAEYTRFFWVDDLWVTGFLIKRLNLRPKKLNSLYLLNAKSFIEKFIHHHVGEVLIFGTTNKLHEWRRVWRHVVRTQQLNYGLNVTAVGEKTLSTTSKNTILQSDKLR